MMVSDLPARVLWLCLWGASAALSAGCGEEDDGQVRLDPPELRIDSLALSGIEHWTRANGGTAELSLGCAQEPLTVTVGPSKSPYRLGGWELRPPGGCGSDRSCGFLVLVVDAGGDKYEVPAARRFIEMPAEALPESSGAILRVELRSDTGEPVEGEQGPVADEVAFLVTPKTDCEVNPAATGG